MPKKHKKEANKKKNIRNKVKRQMTTWRKYLQDALYILCVLQVKEWLYRYRYRYKEPAEREQLVREGKGREEEGREGAEKINSLSVV